MKFYLLTIFPEFFNSPLRIGLIDKALKRGLIEVEILNLRDYTTDKHRTIDDVPYGGGEGMVFKPEPLYRAIKSVKERDPETKVIYLSPQGKLLHQRLAEELANEKSLLLICGRYEGIDERIRAHFIDEEISIGDYVLLGGEVAALVIIEVLSRLKPGVVGTKDSVDRESFTSGLLKYPAYTRPSDFLGLKVPEVLLSGNHREIESYRRKESLRLTLERRPELLRELELTPEDRDYINSLLEKQRIYLFLIHYPVLNKRREKIASAITTIDLHDLARLSRTYGLKGVYLIQPLEEQRKLAQELIDYWLHGKGGLHNPLRREAMKKLTIVSDLEEAIQEVRNMEKIDPLLVGTDASPKRTYLLPEQLRNLCWEKPVCLLFGTAWGLEDSILDRCHYFLEPIWGRLDSYNHLSVRSAASIIVDRILGIYSFYKKKLLPKNNQFQERLVS
ncbi:MAG: tRNA (guanosine(37)-N1)-methyltransferase TrmD [Caldimicrobium sp.]|nr:tRNA (guanosine(37)-N1)-methyltransferase TrmD [Caldimicrobium sp.]MCX7874435.1 tRNA (guanosine(37)-N1)-methyltransferase TrmD [Caldimicrobium sp.]MDW8094948.1 tRNA (guanosine(37)-N1)-methyltransferase TrmD [Caldimicrobium sp.]